MNVHDDPLDLAETCLSVGIALAGVTTLTRKRWLFKVAIAFANPGFLFGLAGWALIAMHRNLQGPQNKESIGLHVTNLDPLVTGTEIQVSGSPLNSCNILIDPTGYRNLEGGTLFTIKNPGGSATSDE